MTDRKRLYLLIAVMTGVSLLVGGITIAVLYHAAMDEGRNRLAEIAQSQARLIEAVARFDSAQNPDFPQDAAAATISQIVDAHRNIRWVGRTGEFTLARREGDRIVFLRGLHPDDLEEAAHLQPVAWDSPFAEPMRRSLSGMSGTLVTADYRGEAILAAYEPISELQMGIVAKIDMDEVRGPFIRAGLLALASAAIVVFVAVLLFLRISSPMIASLQEQHARLNAILETAAEGIITFDTLGSIESWNQAAQRMFGYTEPEMHGRNIRGFLIAPSQDQPDGLPVHELTNDAELSRSVDRELVGIRKDGSRFPVELAISETGVAGHRFYTSIVRDCTERKQAEQNARLAVLGKMLSSVAHESRNLLQRIQAGVDMLRLGIQEDPELLEQLYRIERADLALTRLYAELREYAAPIILERKPCDIRETWRLAWANLALQRHGRVAELRDQPNGVDLCCAVDEFRIEQVFRNLMENSLAACRDPLTVEITCGDAQYQGAAALRIVYRDNGPGLTAEQRGRVFEAFFTTKSKGTGLGMAIAQRIVEAHHGEITASDSNRRGGAEFVIKLPRSS
jgi:PAS domain S-box-containing protein